MYALNHQNRARIAPIASLVLLLLLAGCNPAPKYAKPPAQTPAAFKEAPPQDYKEGQGWKVAQPGDDKIRGKWWEIYKETPLNDLETQVAVSNQTVLQAEANFRYARSLVLAARSTLFPVLTSGPSYSNSRISSTTRGAFVVGSGTTSTTGTATGTTTGTTSTGTTTTTVAGTSTSSVLNTFSFPVDLSYTVDLWHRIRNTIAVNAFNAQASEADIGTALLTTQAELAQDYFEVRALDAQRKLLSDTVHNYEETLHLTQALYSAGIDSDEEVSQAQTQLDTAHAQLTDLGVSRANYEHAMAMLTGRPPATFSLPYADFLPAPPPVPLALPSELLERRPDIAAAERRVASANAEIGVARAAYFPDLSLTAAAGFQTSHFTEWFNWPSRFWSLGPTLSATLLDVGARRAVNEGAQASYDAAVAAYRSATLTAFQGVEDNLSTLRILSQEIGEQHTAVGSATNYLNHSLTRFKAGVDSYLNVITAQNIVLTNRETELQIELRQMTASVGLVIALGGGWDPSQVPDYRSLIAKHPKPAAPPLLPEVPVAAPNPPPLPLH